MKEDNKNNHYKDLIEKAKKAINGKNIKEIELMAAELTKELAMPYIPKSHKKEILELHSKATARLVSESLKDGEFGDITNSGMTPKAIKEELLSPTDEELLIIAVTSLKKFNINMFLEEIKVFLIMENEEFHVQKTLLLQELADQNQFGDYIVKKNNETHIVNITDSFSIYERFLLDIMEKIDNTKGYDDQVKDIAMNMTTFQ